MPKHKYKILLIVFMVAISVVFAPAIYEFSRKEKHRNVLRSIFSLAYEYKTEKHQWPTDFEFLQAHKGFDQSFVKSNWGDEYNSFAQVLELNPRSAFFLSDKTWKMSVDVNGFVHDD